MAQVKKIAQPSTNYRPAGMGDEPRVPGTPAGNAPTKAPSQTIAVTGQGPAPKGQDNHPDQPARVPPPASAATTGPKGSQSVDYHSQQGNRIPADINRPGDTSALYSQQAQQLQDKAGA